MQNLPPEDVLGLSVDQLSCVLDYIVQEASEQNDQSAELKVSPDAADVISCRVELLKCCLCNDNTKLRCLVEHMEKCALKTE